MNNTKQPDLNDDITAIKYLRDELPDEQTIAFEQYLMAHPERLEQLELDGLLIRALPKALEKQQTRAKVVPLFAWLRKPWAVSLATAAACAVIYPLVVTQLLQPSDEVLTNTPQVYLAPTRGDAEPVPVINISANDRYFELIVQVQNLRANQFEITLTSIGDNRIILPAKAVTLMPSGDIKLLLPTRLYPPARYQLSATPINAQGATEYFLFEVVFGK